MPYISGGMNYGGRHIKRLREKEQRERRADRERIRRLHDEKQTREAEAERKRLAEQEEISRQAQKRALADFELFLKNEKYLEIISFLNQWRFLPGIQERIPAQVWLYEGIKNSHIETVNYALEQKADINDAVRLEHTPLVYALKFSDFRSTKMMDYLWERKADISLSHQIDGISPVFHAILSGNFDFDKFKWFIDKGVNINTLRDKNGLSALHYAAKANNYMVMKFLLENKFDVNEPDKNGLTPIQHVHIESHYGTQVVPTGHGSIYVTKNSCIDLLIYNGAKYLIPPEQESAYSVLERMILFAAQNKNDELVKKLLESVKPTDLQRLRLAAIENRSNELVQTLLRSVRDEDIKGLMFAAIKVSDCKLLAMIASCDTNRLCIENFGNELLVEAINRRSFPLVDALVGLGVNVQVGRDDWERMLDRDPNPKIRQLLTTLLLKNQLAEYKKQALDEAKQTYCFWSCSSTAPLKRVKVVDALSDVLEKKQELASLDKFNKLILADPALNSFKDKLERYVLAPIAEEKSGWFAWPSYLQH
ncbi:MAG: ankyrin repeat domain-containing protein [Gammaproteobacteria bacterium]